MCDLSPELADGYRAISDETLALFDREQDNLRAGFDWLVAGGDAERALRMITGLGWFWYIRGTGSRAQTAFAALDLPAPVPDLVRASAHRRFHPRLPEGIDASVAPLAEEALALDRKLGDPARIAYSTMISGLACIALGHYEREFALGEEAYQMATEAGATLVAASSQLLMGRAASMMGDFEGSIETSGCPSSSSHPSAPPGGGVLPLRPGEWRSRVGQARRGQGPAGEVDGEGPHHRRLDELGPSLLALGYIALVHGDEEGARRSFPPGETSGAGVTGAVRLQLGSSPSS